MSVMSKVYEQLNENAFVETAEEFSTSFCRRSKSWYAVQKKKNGDLSIPVAINCLNAVKVKIALAHLRRQKFGSVADSDLQILDAVRDQLEEYLLEHHRIAAVTETPPPKTKMLGN
ncbi:MULTISPECIES: hypothetical protein [unclassified Ruegeria]|uniref:hypothetical protein n=1 Tax=unclassified Ruegeria TaxID=2625375 RepID=UPI001488A82B|nr:MULTISPECIES: hypothetical protein [unclassified Ruegeria]